MLGVEHWVDWYATNCEVEGSLILKCSHKSRDRKRADREYRMRARREAFLLLENESRGMGNVPIAVGGAAGAATTGAAVTGAIIGAGVSLGISLLAIPIMKLLSGQRGKQKTATTAVVNEIEPYMQQNLSAWEGSNKTTVDQKQALLNFDRLWEAVRIGCKPPDNPNYFGKPGDWCIDDRKRGGKFDWFRRYRDPIANDTDVRELTAAEQALPGMLTTDSGGVDPIVPMAVIGLLILMGLGVGGKG